VRLINLVAEANPNAVELPFPSFLFGAIAMGIFTILAIIAWSYRDVANRHEHKGKSHDNH
jgi:heme/copper-type cytochrome/quinol oxidase subunit 2